MGVGLYDPLRVFPSRIRLFLKNLMIEARQVVLFLTVFIYLCIYFFFCIIGFYPQPFGYQIIRNLSAFSTNNV